MKIVIAKTSGFCMGVRRAVEMVFDAPDEHLLPARALQLAKERLRSAAAEAHLGDGSLRAQEVEDHLVEEILRELRLNLTGRQLTDPDLIRARLRQTSPRFRFALYQFG